MIEPGSSHWCPVIVEEATYTNWNIGHSLWTSGSIPLLWWSIGTGCPERSCSLLLGALKSCLGNPLWVALFEQGVGQNGLQRSLPISQSLWWWEKLSDSPQETWSLGFQSRMANNLKLLRDIWAMWSKDDMNLKLHEYTKLNLVVPVWACISNLSLPSSTEMFSKHQMFTL